MEDKFSFYLQQNNNLFKGSVLTICYKVDSKEMQEYGLTGENILILLKDEKLNDFATDIKYFDEIKNFFDKKDIFLRIQSECLLGMYGDSHCDCEQQRKEAIDIIAKQGGLFIQLPQEGQGWGLHYKLQELELQVSGRTKNGEFIGIKNRDEAQKILVGKECFDDCRGYGIIIKILTYLGLEHKKYILISESQKKLKALSDKNLEVIKYSMYKDNQVNEDNISEYLIKILNETHDFDEKVIDEIICLIEKRMYNGRTISTLTSIIERINNDKEYNLNSNVKNKLLIAYDKIICGVEKKYIIDDKIIKIQNNFSCKVNSSVFKTIYNIYNKNIFDRIVIEKLYYFESRKDNNSIRIRTSEVLNTIGRECIFLKGQTYVEQKTFNKKEAQVFQNEISLSKLRAFFENSNYNFIKSVEMVTIVSERQVPGINIYIKKIPNIENRIMDIYGKKEDIQNFLKKMNENSKRTVLNDVVSNNKYEDENFTNYNLRFTDIDIAIKEELKIFDLLNKEGI
ncbi:MAG: hypothetical protein Q4G05_04170 [Clostridia bacterium]|nr:hypothetical protein [Clostridia bacterium]